MNKNNQNNLCEASEASVVSEANELPLTHEELMKNFWTLYTTWDNSMRSMGNQCPRKLYWWLRGYSWKTSAKPIYFLFGSAWHEIKQEYYLSFKTQPELNHAARSINAFNAGKKYWDENENIQDIEAKPNPVDNIHNLNKLWTTFINYYGEEPLAFEIIAKPELGWLWSISQDTTETPLFLGGSIDAFIKHKTFGTIVLEEKSTSAYLTDKYMQQWEYATQLTGYAWMLNQLEHKPIILLQAAHKRVLGPTAKTPQFATCLVEKTPEQLEEFENEWRNFFDSINLILKNNFWPASGKTDPRQCVGGFGFSTCPYRGLCSNSARLQVDPLNFPGIGVREKWTPWYRLGEQIGNTKEKAKGE